MPISNRAIHGSKRIMARARSLLTATDAPIRGDRLRRAMTLNIITGSGAMIYGSVCMPGNLLNVFFKNYLGASASQLGILVAITQVFAAFQLFSIAIYARLNTRKVFWGVGQIVHRAFGFVLAAVSFYAAHRLNHNTGVIVLIGAMGVCWAFATVSSTGWWTWQTDLYPERIRATFFGKRSAILNAVSMIWFFAVVLLLDHWKSVNVFYLYAGIFFIGALAGEADIIFHLLIPEPRRRDRGAGFGWHGFTEPLRNANFVRYAAGIGLWSFSLSIAGPFISPFITDPKGLGAGNTWLGITAAITQAFWILTVGRWGKLMDRFGRKPVVIFSALSPVAWIGYLFLTPQNYMFVLPVLAAIGGIWGPGFGEGNMQLMLTISPDKNRTAYVAWYTTLVGLISSTGAVLGGRLSDAFAGLHWQVGWGIHLDGFRLVVLISTALTLGSVALTNRVVEEGSMPVRRMLAKLTGLGTP